MSLTDYAAWCGALTATVVLVWDIYKWVRTGAQITMKVRPDMHTSGHPQLDGKRLFLIEAANTGDRPTTLTKLAFVYYKGFWNYLRRNAVYSLVKNPGLQTSLPCKLGTGETWDGYTFHTEENDEMLKGGYLYAALYCSGRSRPITVRVRTKT